MVSAVITAGGMGKRMGGNMPKQYIEIDGKPILAHTVEKFQICPKIDEIIIVCGKNDMEFVKKEIVEKYNFGKVKAVVCGGSERQYSVYNGIKSTCKNSDVIMIHDGVRPFVLPRFIEKIAEETIVYGCCVLGTKVKDTVKICDDNGKVTDTPDRKSLWTAQTPQSFKGDIIRKVHERAADEGFLGTDDAMLAERYGYFVKMTEGDYNNIKITTPEDLIFGEAVAKAQSLKSSGIP